MGFVLLMTLAGTCFLWGGSKARAYVPPAAQILRLMCGQFRSIKTVAITQSVESVAPDEDRGPGQGVQRVWLQTPNLYHGEVLGPFGVGDLCYRLLVMASDPRAMVDQLIAWGVSMGRSSLTRREGRIAFCLGGDGPSQGFLLVDKEAFVPLLLVTHGPGGPEGGWKRVRFLDYREVSGGLQPFEMVVESGGARERHYRVLHLAVNVEVPSPLFPLCTWAGTPDRDGQGRGQSDTRLQQRLKELEQRYR